MLTAVSTCSPACRLKSELLAVVPCSEVPTHAFALLVAEITTVENEMVKRLPKHADAEIYHPAWYDTERARKAVDETLALTPAGDELLSGLFIELSALRLEGILECRASDRHGLTQTSERATHP
ncbi:hypothetical protein Lesp02_42210 [Lentzea sp. NBRC 105346]|uniref:hypothetical protein n=1 Tax=Lentzea sp. NBRC 105346 TaxID=3032205 RepID=UPI0024A379D6|nr:hypothetical protein [Lentzea sp. NBRC 105346]GLZ32033.1 hypothetical protein Lesp02_42210 [Lentzea sp. NBRC 105346]